MTMFEEFYFWIISMLEDDPIPYEIWFIYFVIDFSTDICKLSFVGSELKQNPLTNYEYFPLEAHFFSNQSFINIKDIYIAKITVKELIEQALEKNEFKSKFSNKQIFLCERYKEIEYTFNY
jgi:hypothetical protein